MLTLGLDVSTACTGWAVINPDDTYVAMGAIDLSKDVGVYDKAIAVRMELNRLLLKYPITRVYIEENLQSFRRGFSSAKTLSTLARFNGIVSFLAFEVFDIEPVHLNVNAARKALGLKLVSKKNGGAGTKVQVLEWVQQDIKRKQHDIQWPAKQLKSGPRKGLVVLETKCYDMADAYVIAIASMIM